MLKLFRGEFRYLFIGLLILGIPGFWYFFKDLDFYTRDFEEKHRIKGIDISHHNPVYNWPSVSSRKVFCIMKASEGQRFTDPKFFQYWQKAHTQKMICGAYHFFKPGVPADKQFEHFRKTVRFQKGDLLPVLDVELKDCDVDEVNKWIRLCKAHYGKEPIVYTSYLFYKIFLEYRMEDTKLWIYADKRLPFVPSFPGNSCVLWQSYHKGRVDGIRGDVDENYLLVDSAGLKQILF